MKKIARLARTAFIGKLLDLYPHITFHHNKYRDEYKFDCCRIIHCANCSLSKECDEIFNGFSPYFKSFEKKVIQEKFPEKFI